MSKRQYRGEAFVCPKCKHAGDKSYDGCCPLWNCRCECWTHRDVLACVVCASPNGQPIKKAANARPEGVVVCAECVEAITRRQVGIVKYADGSLHITDGRGVEWAKELSAPAQPLSQLELFSC